MSTSSNQPESGGYRIKFAREEFIELLGIAKPRIIYQVKNFFYFSYDGFVMYTSDCDEHDLMGYKIIRGIEFSNYPWVKK